MKPIRLIFLFLFFLVTVSARADKVDDFVRAQLAERHIPGTAIAVIKNGKIIKTKGYGLASIEFNVPATPETVFEIGSVSKQITAAGIMLLVEDGKVNLDEKISTYLPNTPDSWKNVTVRNLLTHTSGIKSYTGLDGFELSRRLKEADFIKTLAPQPLDFPTGTDYVYSNSGYSLLSYIIESASGKNYWEFMRERIFAPLGMSKTASRDPKFIIPNRAVGYEWQNNQLVGRDYNLTDLFGAGAIVSTITDLAKWDLALRNDTLLKKESKLQMWTPLTFTNGKTYPYGFAFRFSDIRGHKLIAHSGQTAGFGASISRYVDDDLTVIALTNLGENGMGTLIAQGVAKFYIPAISLKMMSAKPDDAKISQIVKTALQMRLENNPKPEIFSADLIRSLSTERAKANNLRIASFGAIKNLTFVGDEMSEDKKIYRYRIETAKKMFLWRFVFDGERKVAEMVLEEEE
jgi:CubicO group peptidase (beta-lactamase class C family)